MLLLLLLLRAVVPCGCPLLLLLATALCCSSMLLLSTADLYGCSSPLLPVDLALDMLVSSPLSPHTQASRDTRSIGGAASPGIYVVAWLEDDAH